MIYYTIISINVLIFLQQKGKCDKKAALDLHVQAAVLKQFHARHQRERQHGETQAQPIHEKPIGSLKIAGKIRGYPRTERIQVHTENIGTYCRT